jgi:hypothetical protein
MTTILDVLSLEIKKREKELVEFLGSGAIKEYAEYREICGVIRGLRTADSYLTDLVRKQERYEDE